MRLRWLLYAVLFSAALALVGVWLGMTTAVFIALESVRAITHLIGA